MTERFNDIQRKTWGLAGSCDAYKVFYDIVSKLHIWQTAQSGYTYIASTFRRGTVGLTKSYEAEKAGLSNRHEAIGRIISHTWSEQRGIPLNVLHPVHSHVLQKQRCLVTLIVCRLASQIRPMRTRSSRSRS